jgi:hypothetical protein
MVAAIIKGHGHNKRYYIYHGGGDDGFIPTITTTNRHGNHGS